jgi:SAM-dependent methyltransferase
MASPYADPRSALRALKGRSLTRLGKQAALAVTWPLWREYFRVRPRSFAHGPRSYPYFLHPYNFTWSNERAIEIPIVWDAVRESAGGRVLEIGNVLSHYFPVRHELVDKYERGRTVRNLDVLEVGDAEKYDLIVSISTLEHVGWDEEPRDPEKVIRAVRHLTDQLRPGGRLVVTMPLGYNPPLDGLLAERAVPFTRTSYFRRLGPTTWREGSWEDVAGCRYGEPWPAASGLVVGEVRLPG